MRWRSKSNRISRLVDHLRSPNPLLVETGFPASLLDLFLKNHHRFNTPKSQPNRTDNLIDSGVVTITPSSDQNDSLNESGAVTIAPSSDLPSPAAAIEDEKEEATIGVNPLERRSPGAKVAAVLFLVVALAFGTRRLALGITISAFLLLILEYIGRCFPCARAQFVVESVLRRFFFLAVVRNSVSESGSLMLRIERHSQDSGENDWGVSASSGEIEVVEPEVRVNQNGNCHHVTIRNMMEEEMSSGGEESFTGRVTDGLGMKERKSPNAKLKSKIIRKLVPKKLRHLKKDKKSKGSEAKIEDQSTSWSVKERNSDGISSRRKDTVSVSSESETVTEECNFQVGPAKVDDLKQGSLCLVSDHPPNHAVQLETDCPIFGSGHSHELVKGNSFNKKLVTPNIQIDVRSNSGYVMLVVIVLAGLVGGRILSFLLAIGYFCILKSIHTIRRKESSLAISVQR